MTFQYNFEQQILQIKKESLIKKESKCYKSTKNRKIKKEEQFQNMFYPKFPNF